MARQCPAGGLGAAAGRAESTDSARHRPLDSAAVGALAILITGVMAAGKSTVAQLVAERLPRSVHLRGDVFRRMIASGRASLDGTVAGEFERQLLLRYELAAVTGDRYLAAGFSVVYQDVILGAALAEVVKLWARWPLHVVVLCPSAAVVERREAERDKVGYRGISVAALDRALRGETPRIGLWLDSSDLTPIETADRVLAECGRDL